MRLVDKEFTIYNTPRQCERRKVTDLELGWLAGLLEGEGSFGYYRSSEKDYWVVQVVSTDEDVILKAANIIEGLIGWDSNRKLGPYVRKPSKNGNRKDSWKIAINGRYYVIELIEKLMPFMGVRRREKIEFILQKHKEIPMLHSNKLDQGAWSEC